MITLDHILDLTTFILYRQKLSGKRLVGFLPCIPVLTKYKGTPRVAIFKRQVLRKALAHVTAQITDAVNSPERGICLMIGDKGMKRHLLHFNHPSSEHFCFTFTSFKYHLTMCLC